jgi:MFS family permease
MNSGSLLADALEVHSTASTSGFGIPSQLNADRTRSPSTNSRSEQCDNDDNDDSSGGESLTEEDHRRAIAAATEAEGATFPQSPPTTFYSQLTTMSSELSGLSASSHHSGFDITPRIDNLRTITSSITESILQRATIPGTDDNVNGMDNHAGDHSRCDDSNEESDSYVDCFPRHSDFTIPTSNKVNIDHHHYHHLDEQYNQNGFMAPPLEILPLHSRLLHQHQYQEQTMLHPQLGQPAQYDRGDNDNCFGGAGGGRRSIMGASVGKKYHLTESDRRSGTKPSLMSLPVPHPFGHHHPQQGTDYGSLLQSHEAITPPDSPLLLQFSTIPSSYTTTRTPASNCPSTLFAKASTAATGIDDVNEFTDTTLWPTSSGAVPSLPSMTHAVVTSVGSPITPAQIDPHFRPTRTSSFREPRILPMPSYQQQQLASPYEEYYDGGNSHGDSLYTNNVNNNDRNGTTVTGSNRRQAVHETIHAQSLLLGLAFMAVWSPNNVMAPNLTQMAEFFGMDEAKRDSYLGSYCALAVGVFSIPLAGLIGFTADFYSRKHLFLACVLLGALSSAWAGWSTAYWSLFLARLCSGGCMSGSVPVAFSLLGDLFATEERNAASSGLTAMMGLGILSGQVVAGLVGPTKGWQYPLFASALLQLISAVMIFLWVAEPVRGGKERVLQDLFKSGTKYERQLTMEGFIDAMHKNASNSILLWQGFVTSLPWGIVLVFLNDYLSQEKGFSVPEATFMVMLFGVGCAFGGITGGYIGQMFMKRNRSHLPLYMAATTFLGIFPFVGLLNSDFPNHNGYKARLYAIVGGTIASLPSVSVRPCIINVNPPETRGAALTATNLLVTLGRGIGPSTIVVMGSIFHVSRQVSFNVTLAGFWTISAIQLVFLARTLPRDQDAMEAELIRYAAEAQEKNRGGDEKQSDDYFPVSGYQSGVGTLSNRNDTEGESRSLLTQTPDRSCSRSLHDDGETIVSIEEYRTSFDGKAAKRSFEFVKMGIRELTDEITNIGHACSGREDAYNSDDEEDHHRVDDDDGVDTDNHSPTDDLPDEELQHRRNLWLRQQQKQNNNEQT